jgi:hypothetical protein
MSSCSNKLGWKLPMVALVGVVALSSPGFTASAQATRHDVDDSLITKNEDVRGSRNFLQPAAYSQARNRYPGPVAPDGQPFAVAPYFHHEHFPSED